MSDQIEALQKLLYQALGEPVGLLLNSLDPENARARLYAARRAVGDPALAVIQIRMVELDGGNIALVKGARTAIRPEPLRLVSSPALDEIDL